MAPLSGPTLSFQTELELQAPRFTTLPSLAYAGAATDVASASAPRTPIAAVIADLATRLEVLEAKV